MFLGKVVIKSVENLWKWKLSPLYKNFSKIKEFTIKNDRFFKKRKELIVFVLVLFYLK